jgi:D-alanyl-D-alanine carboxypeptidase/D-alanyl-D-alanine-endopeptidase (penicillin-binding protein 4)
VPGLLIEGGGDPCLDEHFTEQQPERVLADWVTRLQAAGIRRIDGPVLVDGSLFVGPQRPPTYPQDHRNLQQWYSAPASAFAWLDNCIEVQVRPATTIGQPAEVLIRPNSPRIQIVNKSRTVAKVAKPMLLVTRAHHANQLTVSGDYDRPTAWFPMAIDLDADLLHADHFCQLLRQAGLAVPERSERGLLSEQPQAQVLIDHSSALAPALTILNQRSLNLYGEQLLRLVAIARGLPGSVDQGCQAVADTLAEVGFELAGLSLLDGSGLSYENRASARAVCELLRGMLAQAEGPLYRSTLKELQQDGVTLQVKTGTLAVARSLAGYFDRNGRTYAFAILIERVEEKGVWLSKAKTACDSILSALLRIAADS